VRVIVTTKLDGIRSPVAERVALTPGIVQTVTFTSPYLVSAGQTFEVVMQADVEDAPRSLADILQDAIKHGLDFPSHGTNCSCMDRFIRELRSDVRMVLPSSAVQPDWEKRADARSRVIYLLRAAGRDL
jgi:hypothetical protein